MSIRHSRRVFSAIAVMTVTSAMLFRQPGEIRLTPGEIRFAPGEVRLAPHAETGAATGAATVRHAEVFDLSPPLLSLRDGVIKSSPPDCGTEHGGGTEHGCGTSPGAAGAEPDGPQNGAADAAGTPAARPPVSPAAAAVEQKSQGKRPPAAIIESFDGLGVGFEGPQGPATGRNPSDNSLAIGPNHIVQIVNSRLAVFTKKGELYGSTGKVLYGAANTNTIFKGFGGACEERNNGDAVVRYDQLAGRWLYVNQTFQPAAVKRVDILHPDQVTTYVAPSDPIDLKAGLDGMTRDARDDLFLAANGAGQIWKATPGPPPRLCLLVGGLAPFPSGPSAVAIGLGHSPFPARNLYVVTFGGDVIEVPGVVPAR